MDLALMSLADITLACFLLAFVIVGFWVGLIHMVGVVIGLIGGVWIAGLYYQPIASRIVEAIGGNPNMIRIIVFFAILILVSRLFGIAVSLIDRVFRFAAIIPFVKTFNRLLGAVLGLIEGTVFLGLFVYFSARLPFSQNFEVLLEKSKLAPLFHLVGKLLSPLLPKALRLIEPIIS